MPRVRKNYTQEVAAEELELAKVRQIEMETETGAEAAEDEEAELIEQDALQGLRELAGSGEIRWEVHRISTDPDRAGYLATWNTSQLSKEALSNQFGGGKYRIIGKYPNGRYAGMRTVDIAGDVVRKSEREKASVGGVSELLTMMREEREQRRMDSEKRKEDIKFWAAILGPIMTPVLGNLFGSRKEGINELVTALASMKQLQGGEDNIDRFAKIFELVKTVQGEGGGGGETNWLDILKEGLGMAKPALTQIVEKVASGQNQMPGVGANMAPFNRLPSSPVAFVEDKSVSNAINPNEPLPSPTVDNGNQTMLELLPWLKHTGHYLAFRAAANKDPEMYAEWLLDNIPDGAKVETLQSFIAREDWWKYLSQVCPETRPYQGWFEQLRAFVLDMLSQDAQPETSPEQGVEES